MDKNLFLEMGEFMFDFIEPDFMYTMEDEEELNGVIFDDFEGDID